MDRVLVLQSYREPVVSGWLGVCAASVREWCAEQGYAYKYVDDALFARLPAWYREKTGERTPIAADLARLLWISDELAAGNADIVAWVDVDTLVLNPSELLVSAATSCVFGQEFWVQAVSSKKGYKVRRNVHNAYCAFRPDCPILPFLIEAVQRMVRRVDAQYMAPQFVGPKLLTHLHNTVGFELDPHFGALSPELIDALLAGDAVPWQQLEKNMPVPLMAANLCSSLQSGDEGKMLRVIDGLKMR